MRCTGGAVTRVKLPYISRTAFDVQTRELEHAKDLVRAQMANYQQLQERYERLVERTITMQREGFSVVKPPMEEAPAAPFPGVVEQAISDRAFDSVTDRRLRQYAAQALAVPKAEPEAVAARILAGETLDEEYAT